MSLGEWCHRAKYKVVMWLWEPERCIRCVSVDTEPHRLKSGFVKIACTCTDLWGQLSRQRLRLTEFFYLKKKKKRTVRSITRCHCLCTCKKHRPAFTRGSERLVQAGNTLNFNVCLPATVPASLTACLFHSHAGTRATLIRREPRRRMQKKKNQPMIKY